MPNLRLISLYCKTTEDWTGPDEPYLLLNGQQVWGPVSMNDKDTESLAGVNAYQFHTTVEVDLFDDDAGSWIDPDDHLGSNTIDSAEQDKGEQRRTYKNDGANYTLTYLVTG